MKKEYTMIRFDDDGLVTDCTTITVVENEKEIYYNDLEKIL